MKVIEIHIDAHGRPTARPSTQTCQSEETIVFYVTSENPLIESINLAFDDTSAKILFCPGSGSTSRQHYCDLDLMESKDPDHPRVGVLWGIALLHQDPVARELKYSVTPYVGKVLEPKLTLDPLIVITKRP